MSKDDLDENSTDLKVKIGKSMVGAIPFAGTFTSELVGHVIPNQRLDRLVDYVRILDEKLSNVSSLDMNKLKENEQFVDLVEESFIQASRAITESRREKIASIIANGVTDEEINSTQSKYLYKVLQELNEEEIIWLRRFAHKYLGGDENFKKTFENVLKITRYTRDMTQEDRIRIAVQNSYFEHLERLNLVISHYKINEETGAPEFETHTGRPKVMRRELTPLGKLLLEQTGFMNEYPLDIR